MILREIRLYNFGVYAGEQRIIPAVARQGGHRSITLIGGLNGRGKTSLLSAVLLALYGERSPARDPRVSYSAYLKGLIHKHAAPSEGSWVEVSLEVPIQGQTVHLRVRRSWRVANVRAVDWLEIWRNGQFDSFLADTWDSHVEELIPPGLAPLFFFDGERIGDLADLEQTPENVQRAIRVLLGLDVVDKLLLDLGRLVRQNKGKVDSEIMQQELTALEEELNQLEQRMRAVKQDIAGLESLIRHSQSLLDTKQEEYFRRGGTFVSTHSAIANKLEQFRQSAAQLRSELQNLAAGPLPLLLVLPLLQRARHRLEREEQRRQAEAALPILKERNARLLEALRTEANDNALLTRLLSVLASQEAELEQLVSIERVFPVTSVGVGQLYDFVDRLAPELREKAADLWAQFHRIETERELLERHRLVEIDQGELTNLLNEMARLNERIGQLKLRQLELEKQLSELKVQRDRVIARMDKLNAGLMEAEDVDRIVRFAERVQEHMKLFRERLVQEKVGRLTKTITEAFKQLTHKNDLVERVDIDSNTLAIRLFDRDGRRVDKASLSSGEKQMLAIAVLWGLAQASGFRLPVIIDTPMGRLDSSHRMNFVTSYLPYASHQVIVLSTDTEIVGPYLQALAPYVGAYYLLHYDQQLQQTRVEEGYFSDSGSRVDSGSPYR